MALPALNRLGEIKRKMLAGEPITMDDFRGGSSYGGQTTSGSLGQRERYQEKSRAGGAPFTAEGLLAAGRNTLGLMSGMGAIKSGISSTLNVSGAKPKGFMGDVLDTMLGPGVQNIPGHYAPTPKARAKITDMHSYLAALDVAEKESAMKKAQALAKSLDKAAKINMTGARSKEAGKRSGGARSGGGIGSGNATGGPGYGTAR